MPRHDHDLGLAHDMSKILGRRRLLTLLAGFGMVATSSVQASALECVALPWETAGPYPGDGTNAKDNQIVNVLTKEGVIRQDIRSSFAGLTPVADGVRLDLELRLVNADGCIPLAGHVIYAWHCDTLGKYSLYDTVEANYLRGVGIADDKGMVKFTTVFPGCYDGRWPHVHFEIFETITAAVSGESSVLTAQFALPEQVCSEVYAADNRYSNGTRNLGRISIPTDNVFSDNTQEQLDQQMLRMAGSPADGYVGALEIPIDFDADRTLSRPPPPQGHGQRMRPPLPNEFKGKCLLPQKISVAFFSLIHAVSVTHVLSAKTKCLTYVVSIIHIPAPNITLRLRIFEVVDN